MTFTMVMRQMLHAFIFHEHHQHCWLEWFIITRAHADGLSPHHLHYSPDWFSCTLELFHVIDGDGFSRSSGAEVMSGWLPRTCVTRPFPFAALNPQWEFRESTVPALV